MSTDPGGAPPVEGKAADGASAGGDAPRLTLVTLTAMVVASMVGAGMLMLAYVFQTPAVRKPDLDAGVYAYAKAGFGEYLGFFPPAAPEP